MRISLLALFAGLSLATAAHADPASLNIAVGASIPKDSTGATLVEKNAPARAAAERFSLYFAQPKTVTSIRVTARSTSRKGKLLITAATAYRGPNVTQIDALNVFGKAAGGGKIENSKGHALLNDGAYVEVQPNAAYSRLDLTVQGMIASDASFLLQVGLEGAVAPAEFLVTRTAFGETLGTLVNEAGYAKFSADQVKGLLALGVQPTADDLVGHTYSCSSYPKVDATRTDFKTRIYARGPAGELLSSSDAEGADLQWAPVQSLGLALTVPNRNGCGSYNTFNVVRITGAGNLVAEVALDLENYISLCTAAGYDTTSTKELETYSTFPSILDAKYVVGSYEFCKVTK